MESHYGHPGGGFRTGALTGKTAPVWRLRCLLLLSHQSRHWLLTRLYRRQSQVNDGTLTNHDNQIVFGTANGMTISTGLEYGPDNEANTGGQWIQNGGTANNTTVTGGGLQRVNAGGSVFRHGYQCRRRTEPFRGRQ